MINKVFLIIICCCLQGCRQRGCTDPEAENFEPQAKADDGTCISYGFVNIFMDSPCNIYDSIKREPVAHFTTITIDGDTIGVVGEYYYGANPECDKNYQYAAKLYPGTYSYFVKDSCDSWEGEFDVTSEQCQVIFLKR